MKNIKLREKLGEKLISSRRLAAFMAVVLFMNIFPVVVYATTTQQKLEQAQQQHQQTQQQLDQTQEALDNLKDSKATLQEKMNALNEQLQEISDKLDELAISITNKEAEITATQAALDEAKATEEWQYECMKKRIQFMYEKSDTTYVEMFLASESFADFLNLYDYINQISKYDRDMLDQYEANRKNIEDQEAQLVTEKADLDSLKVQAEQEQAKVNDLITEVASNISKYADQIDGVEATTDALESKAAQEDANIQALQKQIEEEKRLSQLAATSSKRDISEVTFAEGDYYLLANLIYCEAGGESYAGQVAVGAVVINRVLSSVFPDTVVGVIYARKQFAPVASGRLALALAQNKATASCYQAASEAMSGVTNVGNCVYFRTPIPGLTGISIGGHIFY